MRKFNNLVLWLIFLSYVFRFFCAPSTSYIVSAHLDARKPLLLQTTPTPELKQGQLVPGSVDKKKPRRQEEKGVGRVAMGWSRKQEQKAEIPSLLSPYPTVGALTVESGYSFKPPRGTSSAQTLDISFPALSPFEFRRWRSVETRQTKLATQFVAEHGVKR